MTTRQRHTAAEIATKLALADELAAKGRFHGDIAKSLGISVMTYHRWRKARRLGNGAAAVVIESKERDWDTRNRDTWDNRDRDSRDDRDLESATIPEQMIDIRELRLENLRLRRLVTDLLLEKDKLQEDLRASVGGRRSAHGIRRDV